jgi:hypothetical protein
MALLLWEQYTRDFFPHSRVGHLRSKRNRAWLCGYQRDRDLQIPQFTRLREDFWVRRIASEARSYLQVKNLNKSIHLLLQLMSKRAAQKAMLKVPQLRMEQRPRDVWITGEENTQSAFAVCSSSHSSIKFGNLRKTGTNRERRSWNCCNPVWHE